MLSSDAQGVGNGVAVGGGAPVGSAVGVWGVAVALGGTGVAVGEFVGV